MSGRTSEGTVLGRRVSVGRVAKQLVLLVVVTPMVKVFTHSGISKVGGTQYS